MKALDPTSATADTLGALASAGTCVIADVFDSLQLAPQVLCNELDFVGTARPFAGPAYTITGETVAYTGGDRAKLAAIDAMLTGVVALWASQDARGVCCFGDLLSTSMQARGVAAAVVDGGVRDATFLRQSSMPVMARYRTPAQGVGRWRVSASQVPVQVRGALSDWITVHPGDILVGDADGVVVVPSQLYSKVLARVMEWQATEQDARRKIADGMPLLEALDRYGHL